MENRYYIQEDQICR